MPLRFNGWLAGTQTVTQCRVRSVRNVQRLIVNFRSQYSSAGSASKPNLSLEVVKLDSCLVHSSWVSHKLSHCVANTALATSAVSRL